VQQRRGEFDPVLFLESRKRKRKTSIGEAQVWLRLKSKRSFQLLLGVEYQNERQRGLIARPRWTLF
jgi:hypothetical protein